MNESTTVWQSGLTNRHLIRQPGSEVTPFVMNDRLYLLENSPKWWDFYPEPCFGRQYHEDEIRIRDVATGEIVSTPLRDHYFGLAFVTEGRCYVFAGRHPHDHPFWQIKEVSMTWSDDLVNWSEPETVLHAENNESIFNFGLCPHPAGGFVLLYETDDPQWPKFTFKYCRSNDLKSWERIPNAIYGHDKYVGGPALYFENGWFYTLYLESLGKSRYETRITRSRDLITWEDAPDGRPFVTFDGNHITDEKNFPGVAETNASDVELCYFEGKTLVYFNGGNQGEINVAADLQRMEFNGTPQELFESFFRGA